MMINLIPQTNVTTLTCSEGDTALRKWVLPVYGGQSEWLIDADTVKLICSNGAEVTGSIENNRVVLDCTADLSRDAGSFLCQLVFTKGAEKLTSSLFLLKVEGLI